MRSAGSTWSVLRGHPNPARNSIRGDEGGGPGGHGKVPCASAFPLRRKGLRGKASNEKCWLVVIAHGLHPGLRKNSHEALRYWTSTRSKKGFMAGKKKNVPGSGQGSPGLLLEVEPEPESRQPAGTPRFQQEVKPQPAEEVLSDHPLRPTEPSSPAAPPETGPLAIISLDVKEGAWAATGMVVTPDGELIDEMDAKGFVAATGCTHPGWLLAACEALRWCQAKGVKAEINIPDPAAVGFLVVTLPTTPQARMCGATSGSVPWPDLYREFLDLQTAVRPRVRWTPH